IPVGTVGVYTHRWGRTAGTSVTDGHKAAREVVVRRGRVVSNRWGVSRNRRIQPDEKVLVGVGPRGNARLKPLRRGRKVTFTRTLAGGRAQMAITGDRPLLVDGVRRVVNDRLAHPRTAVGIDRDGRRLLLLVVDGRSSASRGFTMVELADMMTSLGAEDALNLDGGGSSAMWSRRIDGTMGVINTPSDGVERRVPNGLGVIYTGTLGPVVTPTAP
ncbi:MAG: phosphodiester glycosidase family protein, partial [Nocardioides sp.]|nr:phosphodiester glycosidase family protein [Nocardioides sp.]